MLLFQMIPYFLGLQIINENEIWRFGPEYTFLGQVKMITSLNKDKGTPLGTVVQLNLKCRPREPDILRCQMEDTKISRLKPQAFDVNQAEKDFSDNYRDIGIFKSPFEIKFNNKGIESYIVEKTNPPTPNWQINMARLIANQFSFGADLSDEMRSNYRGWENFTVGECDVRFTVNRKPMNNDEEKLKKPFVLIPLEKLGTYVDEIITIVKDRSMDKCLKCVDSFFGTRYTLGLVLKDVLTDLKTSRSIITTSSQEFVTETINENDLYGEDRMILGKVIDHIKLNLISVLPAKEELPKMIHPISLGVLPEKSLE